MKRVFCLLLCLLVCLSALPAASAAASIPSADSTRINADNKMVVMRVTYATAEFSEDFGGVVTAVPIKESDCYTLYDVVLYSDRICLYKFPRDVEAAAWDYASSHPGWTSIDTVWREYRDSCCLKMVKVKNDVYDPDLNSAKRLSAYKAFFKIIKKRTPSCHIGVKYSGHDGGRRFCRSLSEKDTLKLLKYAVKLFGQKFAFIDYGTNCRSGDSNVLDYYADYTDYMLVSQLDVGGWEWDNWDGQAFMQVDESAVYDRMFVKGDKVVTAVKRLAAQLPKKWVYGKKYMRKHKIPQSITAVKMSEYKKLMAKATGTPPGMTDLYLGLKKLGKSALLKLYNKAFIYYANNKAQLGRWKNEYGYGIWFWSGY